MSTRLIAVLSLLCCGMFLRQGVAQEFRIYTKVYDERTNAEDPVARSLTLFHAGRVYDFLAAIGEVIIFEPMHDRFVVLNTERRLTTTVHTDEIKQLLRSAHRVARKREQSLRQQGAAGRNTAEMLAFQMEPSFRTDFDGERKRLSLRSPHLRYEVHIAPAQMKEISKAYRQYADGICRLNFVLHPRVLLPGPRLVLNRELAKREAIPVEVDLRINTQPQVHLRAEHRIHWSLDRKDRALIQQWNSLLQSERMQKVTLRKYQQVLGIEPVGNKR